MKVKIDPNIEKELLMYVTENILNKTPPELIATELDEEIYFPVTIEDDDVFYHGTSELLGEVIKKLGLLCIPRISGIPSTHGSDEIFQDFIYVTNDKIQADLWAKNRAYKDNSPPVIFQIKGKDINDADCRAFVDPLYFT